MDDSAVLWLPSPTALEAHVVRFVHRIGILSAFTRGRLIRKWRVAQALLKEELFVGTASRRCTPGSTPSYTVEYLSTRLFCDPTAQTEVAHFSDMHLGCTIFLNCS